MKKINHKNEKVRCHPLTKTFEEFNLTPLAEFLQALQTCERIIKIGSVVFNSIRYKQTDK